MGTVWLNIGDAYTSGNRRYRAPDKKNRARAMKVRPPTPGGLKPKDLIRGSVEIGVRAARCRVVASFGSDLAQTERASGIGSGPAYESARNIVSTFEEPKLLLRRRGRPRTERTEIAHCLGHSYGAQKERTCGRSPSDHAYVARKQMRQHYHQTRKRRARSLRRLGNNFACRAKTRSKMGGCRTQSLIRRHDRATNERQMTRRLSNAV